LADISTRLGFAKGLAITPRVLVFKGSGVVLDGNGARLLESIKMFGSISMAAKDMGEDYRLAWMKINGIERALGREVVERILGGVGGGSAKLTLEGEILLQKYLIAEKRASRLLNTKTTMRADLCIMGSHCNVLEILIRRMEEKFENFLVENVNVGSENGLRLVLAGIADISGVHLFDERSGEYNMFLLRDKRIGHKIALIRGYSRMQGIIVRKRDPKGIRSVGDLFRGDVTFINRNKGSGTRNLIEAMIKSYATERGWSNGAAVRRIRGYENEVRSHFETAVAIKYNKADAGIGIEAAAKSFDLSFTPLRKEEFDFTVLRSRSGEENIRKFVEVLSSKGFRADISRRALGIGFDGQAGKISVSL
jgi:putative molybdopterin biosynthesis protein